MSSPTSNGAVDAERQFQLGLARLDGGLPEEAEKCFREALALELRHARASVNLGMILQQTGRPDEAERHYRAAMEADPGLAPAWFNLGTLYLDRHQPARALEFLRGAVARDARHAGWHSALGWTLRQCGDAEGALGSFREAWRLAPKAREYASDVLDALNFVPAQSAQTLFEAHRAWGAARAAPPSPAPWQGDPAPDRKLRIGYLAPDFNAPGLAALIEPVLERHDHTSFDVLCYSDAREESGDAWRIRARVEAWHATAFMSDDQLAGRILEDRIDILVDLAGHGARGRRVALFEKKPAPLQVSWLGYPCTTGLATMDLRITDGISCPPGEERLATERVLRLPVFRGCYKPLPAAPDPGRPPFAKAGGVTFGSCRPIEEMSNHCIALWSSVLRMVPQSRFMLAARGAREMAGLLGERFRAHGIETSRVEYVEAAPEVPDLRVYAGIDITLDASPCAGVATSLDSLWMGVPVVTLAGATEASRSGAGILSAIGMDELIAGSEEEYARIAAALAADRQRLESLRGELRQRVERSPLTDAGQFCVQLETLYRQAWRERPPAAEQVAAAPAVPAVRAGPPPCVVVDGVFFQEYATGIGRVWRMLLAQWVQSGFAERVLLLDREGTAPRIGGLRMRTVPRHSYGRLDEDRAMLQAVCDEERATVFVSTYFSAPKATPAVMLVHDMIPEVLGMDLTEACWREKAHCIARASRFLAVSRSTARDLRLLHPAIPAARVNVAHNGVDAVFRPAEPGEIEAFRLRHGIDKPYYLFVGSRPNYKNAMAFFRAFALLADRAQYCILCVGNVTQLEPREREACGGADVRALALSDEDLRLAYAGAVALVFPSFYEGFGMPVAEAMASACPVITTSHSSLPEVAGEAGIYVNPHDHRALAAAMARIRDPGLRAALVAKGRLRARQFSWRAMASALADVLSDASQST